MKKVQRIVAQYVEDQDTLAQWFGRYMTSPKYVDEEIVHEEFSLEDLRRHLLAGGRLVRNEGSRFAFQEKEDSVWLFVDGRQYACDRSVSELAKTLCADRVIDSKVGKLNEKQGVLLVDLLTHGSLYLADLQY